MIVLDTTSMVLRLVSSSTSALDVTADATTFTASSATPVAQNTAITTATTTTVVSAPAASAQKIVKNVTVENKGAASNTVSIERFDGTTAFKITSVTLQAGETLTYSDAGWQVLDTNGRLKVVNDISSSPIAARKIDMNKVGAASKAAGTWHSDFAATGFPSAWSPGTPGLAGRATDGMSAGDAGCIPLWTPTANLWVDEFVASLSSSAMYALWDVLWVNSGIVVTTTTAQTINSAALPARDLDGTINGRGCRIGLLVTTATTNAGAITNMTLSYTNSDGVAGRTATMASFPITANAGTYVEFQLQAGDQGVKSIQSITLGTSLVTGAVSLIVSRTHAAVGITFTNAAYVSSAKSRLYSGTCLLPFTLKTGTTAMNAFATLSVVER